MHVVAGDGGHEVGVFFGGVGLGWRREGLLVIGTRTGQGWNSALVGDSLVFFAPTKTRLRVDWTRRHNYRYVVCSV